MDSHFTIVSENSPSAAFLVTPGQSGVIEHCHIASGMIGDFNNDLYECAGCRLPVLEAEEAGVPVIKFKIENRAAENEDSFAITFPEERTMLITGSTASLRWALNRVLEKYAGVRWLAPSKYGAHFPRIKTLSVPREEIKVSPSFNLSRRTYYNCNRDTDIPRSPGFNPDEYDSYWHKRMNNYHISHLPGLPVYRVPASHQLAQHVFPFERYARDGKWPDYIFPVVGGGRYLPYRDKNQAVRWQDYAFGWHPCFTDKRAEGEAVRNIVEFFDSNPGVRGASIALNDMGAGFCECRNCGKLKGEGRVMTGHRDYSDLYFQWANRVAEGVAKVHPDKYLGALAYRETLNPPSFRLHDNIVPYITYDIQSCEDPGVRRNWTNLLESWSGKAKCLGRWEYSWGASVYVMPRVYFKLQQEMMQTDYANGARAAFGHASRGAIEDGPKKYLYHKLLWDVDLDLEETLRDWYEAAFGKEAAPRAGEYFRIWEEIWREEAVKTSWFKHSKNSTYLDMSSQNYLYAVRPGDLPRLRGLTEKVAELAGRYGDERQKRRAEWLAADFEYTEAVVYASGGGIFPLSGVVETAEQALEYLKFLPEAVRYDKSRPGLHKKRMAVYLEPDFRDVGRPGVYGALAMIAGKASEPKVMEALSGAGEDKKLPPDVRGLVDVIVKLDRGEPVENLMVDGTFEKGNQDWGQGAVTRDRAYRGKNSLRLNLAPPHKSFSSLHQQDITRRGAKHGWYFASLMVYIDAQHNDPESYVTFRVIARREGEMVMWGWDTPDVAVVPGEWTRMSLVVNMTGGDILDLQNITFHNYSEGDAAYIDDVAIVPLGQAG